MSDRCHIGTSGFYYDHWKGIFYPPDLPKSRYFEYYASHFDTVEMNSIFYHLPKSKTIEHWLQKSPEHFLFSIKAYRGITHYKKLEAKEELYLFIHLIKPLRPKLGAILFQLPPSLHFDLERLAHFLQLLPAGYRYAVEFRHSSWYQEATYELLRRYEVAMCLHDFGKKITPFKITAPFIYVRFHGANGRYVGSYDESVLASWAQKLRPHCQTKEIFCYFNNDFGGAAIEDAKRLRALLEAE